MFHYPTTFAEMDVILKVELLQVHRRFDEVLLPAAPAINSTSLKRHWWRLPRAVAGLSES